MAVNPVRTWGAVALVALATALAGCSSGHGSSSPTTSTSVPASSTTTTVPIVAGPKVAAKAVPAAVWADAFCRAVAPLEPFRNLTDVSEPASTKIANELSAQVMPVSRAVVALAKLGYPDVPHGQLLAQQTVTNYAQAPIWARTVIANPRQLQGMSGEFLRASTFRVIQALFQRIQYSSDALKAAAALKVVEKGVPACQGLE